MSRVSDLEQDIAQTRSRLHGTIEQIQSRLTVSGIVDEVIGQAGVPRIESGHDFVLTLLRRHPIPVMAGAALLGFLVYRMNRRAAAEAKALSVPVDPASGLTVADEGADFGPQAGPGRISPVNLPPGGAAV